VILGENKDNGETKKSYVTDPTTKVGKENALETNLLVSNFRCATLTCSHIFHLLQHQYLFFAATVGEVLFLFMGRGEQRFH
jgi:hypothetical protein